MGRFRLSDGPFWMYSWAVLVLTWAVLVTLKSYGPFWSGPFWFCTAGIQGRISVGSDGDLVIWDESVKQRVSAKCRSTRTGVNVYDGMSFHGQATHVIYAGHVVVDNEGVSLTYLLTYTFLFIC